MKQKINQTLLLIAILLVSNILVAEEITKSPKTNNACLSEFLTIEYQNQLELALGTDTTFSDSILAQEKGIAYDIPITSLSNENITGTSSIALDGLVVPASASAATGDDFTSGLVSVWDFNETSGSDATDSYGSNTGVITGCAMGQSSTTNLSTSYGFDGNDRVTVNGAAGADYTSGVSISLWLKPNNTSYTYDGKVFDMGSSSTKRITLCMKNNLTLYFGVGQVNYAGYTTLSSSEWSHIILIWDKPNTNLKIYKNGLLMYNGTSGNPTIANYANIGNEYNNGASRYYKGGMDQVILWNRPITESEVSTLYNSGDGLAASTWLNPGGGAVSSVNDQTGDVVLNLSNSISGTNRTIDITGTGIGTTINVADNDNDSSNEIQTFDVASLNGSILELSLSGDEQSTKEIDLSTIGGGTADNLGDHSATQNIKLNGKLLSNNGTDGIKIDDSGNIGINTNPDANYVLSAEGKIRAREVLVETTNWADFVFSPSYKLKSLTEVEQFIKTNGHLPDIPSEVEVKQNGMNVGEINSKLLQKIEELTLYIIKQQKEIEELKDRTK